MTPINIHISEFLGLDKWFDNCETLIVGVS